MSFRGLTDYVYINHINIRWWYNNFDLQYYSSSNPFYAVHLGSVCDDIEKFLILFGWDKKFDLGPSAGLAYFGHPLVPHASSGKELHLCNLHQSLYIYCCNKQVRARSLLIWLEYSDPISDPQSFKMNFIILMILLFFIPLLFLTS